MDWVRTRWRGYLDFSAEPVVEAEKHADVDHSRKSLYAALVAEFLGLLLFQLYGGEAHESVAAFGNGLSLAVILYCTANISGGHLNPAVTLALTVSGHTSWRRGLLYMLAQFGGGIVGVLFQVALIPDVNINMGDAGPGCFTHLGGTFIRRDQLFGWECIMTFLLVATVYAVAIGRPGFGNIGPLMVGYTLFASAFIGGRFTGAALNPARVFGPALVFNCYWDTAFIYMAAQFTGGLVGALLNLPIYGPGPEFSGALSREEVELSGSRAWGEQAQGLMGNGKQHHSQRA